MQMKVTVSFYGTTLYDETFHLLIAEMRWDEVGRDVEDLMINAEK